MRIFFFFKYQSGPNFTPIHDNRAIEPTTEFTLGSAQLDTRDTSKTFLFTPIEPIFVNKHYIGMLKVQRKELVVSQIETSITFYII